MLPPIEDCILEFKGELQSLTAIQVVRKHILSGGCYTLNHGIYFDLRSEVANKFEIHPNEVLIVGSSKLGFSIAPQKRYRPFSDISDIDIVMVSPTLYEKVWKELFDFSEGGSYESWEMKQRFEDYFFRGWVRPDMFPSASAFPFHQEWREFFRELTRSGKYGPYKIAGALYKSWYFLEKYQCICVKGCQLDLGVIP